MVFFEKLTHLSTTKSLHGDTLRLVQVENRSCGKDCRLLLLLIGAEMSNMHMQATHYMGF